jgi:hypothetical protein
VSLTTSHRQETVHEVVFFSAESELVGAVVDHLLPALAGDGTAVLAATTEHLALFAAGLAAAGVDWGEAASSGRLHTLDARAVASDLTAGGRLDPSRFAATVGTLMEQATAGPGPVRVFGEIVAVLWDAGDQASALGLESLWNELLGRLAVDLLCAYPATISPGPVTLADLCAAHSAVGGTLPDTALEASAELGSRHFRGWLSDVAEARRFVIELLESHGPADLADAAALVVTELTSNAVLHAGTSFVVTVVSRPGGVRIAVADRSRRLPVPRDREVPHRNGRGLRLVAALSADWGTHIAADGSKLVWAELTA